MLELGSGAIYILNDDEAPIAEQVYMSIKEAAEDLGLHHSNIVACCNNRRSTCGGLQWEYVK